MTKTEIQQKTLEAIVILSTALKNLRLYPPSSAIIVNVVDKLQDTFLEIFAQEISVDLAESEKRLLVNGEALPLKDQERPQVVSLVGLLINFAIKSITFQRGMSKEELLAFLELMVQSPQDVSLPDGGLPAALAARQVSHILTNLRVYIAKDQDSQLLASLDVKDEDIVKYMTDAYPDQDFDVDKLRDMVRDEAWVANIFQSGMAQIMKDRGVVGTSLLTQSMMRMFSVLDKVTNRLDQERICELIAKSIADLDPEMISLIMSQDIEGLFGGNLFQQVIDQMDDEKFEGVARQMNDAAQEQPADVSLAAVGGREVSRSAHQRLMASKKGEELRDRIAVRQAAELTEQEQNNIRLHEQVQEIVQGPDDLFLKDGFPESLSGISRQLLADGEQALTERLIDRVVRALGEEAQDIRDQAAAALVEIIIAFPADRQMDPIRRIAGFITEWIRRETTASRAYRKICSWQKELVRDYIFKGDFADAIPILDVFNRIHGGLLDKNDTIDAIAADTIRELASGEALTILFDEFDNNRQSKQLEAGRVLVRLGDGPLNRLMDRLREVEDTNERVRILQVIADIGPMAIPAVRERIQGDEPWYYLRNLAYLMGKVGKEESAHVLQPLLLHNNGRVRIEALTSLHRTGGKERGPLMMSILPVTEDDDFKMKIIEMLGLIKYAPAVPMLVDLLTQRPLVVPALRIDLEEKICISLGKIAVPESTPVLKEISRPKGFFRVSKYPEKVRTAATRALAAIEEKGRDSNPSNRR